MPPAMPICSRPRPDNLAMINDCFGKVFSRIPRISNSNASGSVPRTTV